MERYPNQNRSRIGAFLVGAVLLLGAVGTSAATHDSVVAGVLAIGGVALVVWSFLGDRLKSLGPKGVELFEATKEQLAERIDADSSLAGALQSNRATGQAAAAIRAARSPGELADVVVSLLDRPVPPDWRDPHERVEGEREMRARGWRPDSR